MGTPYLFLSLFLFSALLSNNAAQTPPAVLDTDGNTVQGGVKYVIVPVQASQGGGLDLASTGSQTCPKSVVQVAPKATGNSVTFFPVNPKDVVRNGTDLNVQFSGSNAGCPSLLSGKSHTTRKTLTSPNIGITVENGQRRLVVDLRLTPLEVNFKKA
nr:kunitz trypsin inhibitor 2-like [Ipomoea batatas]